jgi:hypothetical protein
MRASMSSGPATGITNRLEPGPLMAFERTQSFRIWAITARNIRLGAEVRFQRDCGDAIAGDVQTFEGVQSNARHSQRGLLCPTRKRRQSLSVAPVCIPTFRAKTEGLGDLSNPCTSPGNGLQDGCSCRFISRTERGYYERHLPPKVYGSLPTTVGEIISKPDAVAELITAAASNS